VGVEAAWVEAGVVWRLVTPPGVAMSALEGMILPFIPTDRQAEVGRRFQLAGEPHERVRYCRTPVPVRVSLFPFFSRFFWCLQPRVGPSDGMVRQRLRDRLTATRVVSTGERKARTVMRDGAQTLMPRSRSDVHIYTFAYEITRDVQLAIPTMPVCPGHSIARGTQDHSAAVRLSACVEPGWRV